MHITAKSHIRNVRRMLRTLPPYSTTYFPALQAAFCLNRAMLVCMLSGMEITLLEYPPCSTCRKARTWLEQQGVPFTARHITQSPPTAAELAAWQQLSGLPLRRFFNTSGLKYRALGLASKLPQMTDDELLALLAGDGMLVKRPLLITPTAALPGFREAEWKQALGK